MYDKNGIEAMEKVGGDVDPTAFFAKTFGGDAFYDLVRRAWVAHLLPSPSEMNISSRM